MTMVQISLYISQIQWISPLERIRYYLRDIKNVLFSYFTKDYEVQQELDEDETVESHKEKEFEEIKRQAILHNISPPTK